MALSKASVAMAAKTQDRGAQRRLAEQLNVSPSLVTRWNQGMQKPVTRLRQAIEAIYPEIRISDWDTATEERGAA